MTFYLPAGRWTNLLDGRVAEGERWLRERHGFDSLPLWVREGAVLPFGAVEDPPDYDYTVSPRFEMGQLADGASARTVLRDASGTVVVRFEATRTGSRIDARVTQGVELLPAGWTFAGSDASGAMQESNGSGGTLTIELS